jgi:alkaline phosphatase D
MPDSEIDVPANHSGGIMNRTRWTVLFACLPWLVCGPLAVTTAQELQPETTVTRIGFGSCIRQDRQQPIWQAIIEYHPDLFLLTGDNIYGDSEDVEVLQFKYNQLGSNPGYQKLKSICPILATWDDHDYGLNDGGGEFSAKRESQQLFNDFFETPAGSPRRQREGIYDAVILGPEGRRVQIILLDTRYFRSPLNAVRKTGSGLGPYGPSEDATATMLGETQWQWLEQQLRRPAEVRVIVSSVQFVPHEHGWEMWGNFPRERKRMLQLITDTNANGVLFISGDRHLAELSRMTPEKDHTPYPILDLTSSSLNQPSGGGNENEPNRYRVGEHYLKVNFGTIEIAWTESPTLTLAIRDLHGETVLEHHIPLLDLQHP